MKKKTIGSFELKVQKLKILIPAHFGTRRHNIDLTWLFHLYFLISCPCRVTDESELRRQLIGSPWSRRHGSLHRSRLRSERCAHYNVSLRPRANQRGRWDTSDTRLSALVAFHGYIWFFLYMFLFFFTGYKNIRSELVQSPCCLFFFFFPPRTNPGWSGRAQLWSPVCHFVWEMLCGSLFPTLTCLLELPATCGLLSCGGEELQFMSRLVMW